MTEPGRQPDPERDAEHVLKTRWAEPNGTYNFPVDPIQIATRLGAEVFVSKLSRSVAGKLETPGTSGVSRIDLSVDNGEKRQRFTCAHEVGHLYSRQKKGLAGKFTDYRDNRAALGTDPDEIYANGFAAALLMPRAFVKRDHKAGKSLQALAARYGVSETAMGFRLDNLGLT